MNTETFPSPSKFKFDKRSKFLIEMHLRVSWDSKGGPIQKYGEYPRDNQNNLLKWLGKVFHLSLVLAPIVLTQSM
jgi:hypothetical protein